MSAKQDDALRVVVAQLGARMHYAVPILFAQHGVLAHFYTDLYLDRSGIQGALSFSFARSPLNGLQRLASRYDARLPAKQVTAFTELGLTYTRALRKSRTRFELEQCFVEYGSRFAQKVADADWHEANAVYAFNGAALEIFSRARAIGVLAVLEQTLAPLNIANVIYKQEIERWGDWQALGTTENQFLIEREAREWQAADGIICASEFVANGLETNGVERERCIIVPYAVDVSLFAPKSTDAPGMRDGPLRVLYVGGVDLRKGIQYLYQALALLKSPRPVVKVVGANMLSPRATQDLSAYCALCGLTPRAEIPALMRWADVFVLPTLCEGSATVIYEALASGLPIITTTNAGSVVRDGIDGYVVPIRDPDAIAERLERLAQDRALVREMSRQARIHAETALSWEAYALRLLAACQEIRRRKMKA